MTTRTFDAVFWDFGGVITTSPFEAFNRYEAERGIPLDFIRGVNTHNPDDNAWAKIERREVSADEFDALFAAESEALGHRVPGRDVLGCLYGSVRPEMLAALHSIRDSGRIQACLTNNVSTSTHDRPDVDEAMAIFVHVIESSKVGLRKPEPAFYELACTTAGVSPDRVVFLDDLGINLKPAAAMGMATIKVVDPSRALTELGELLQMSLI
ncbi:MAG: HAD-IA family hydrolase [Actinomycetota bacterium]|jgi:putative hydrolase of the HAD superfamily|nr:HAD-IA family hydrolase [Actinomycetota bacterium]MDA3015151.1 HAD-IA family hydrolase [Actinomycetota bacterium]MDA3027411.1 HAD-IA family hydrolase [Actinomycetota bacterium]